MKFSSTLIHSFIGLFHKVILQSGSALNPWAQTKHSALEFVKFMGENVNNEKEALHYLRNVPVNDILVNQNKFIESHKTKISIIGPTVEKPNGTELISERPIDHIKSGNYNQVPMMIGYCSNEGLLAATGDEMFHVPYSKGEEHNLDLFIPWFMEIQKESTESELVCRRIADVYLKEENISNKFLLTSDFYFISGIIASAIQHARTSACPVYLYRMDLDTNINFLKILANIREHPGMCHADDLGYIFNITCIPGMEIGDVERRAVRRCVELWTNFAKYGNPTPKNNTLDVEWKPIEEDHLHYLNIGNDGLVSDKNPELERMNTWRDIYRISPHTSGFM
ncbi:unnamed protein product [Phaedon cochleariae]|uniref:Carboxylesterase type B domain-containing protein n=1 Tax=Phaedon cochleariae TaxID=80249 RepID=A0A9N9SCL1_PHACE|nr:unnamed protein product [Phaedon cochleariae]